MLNLGETNLSLTDGINSNLEFFFNDFDDLFNEKITKNFIERLSEITKEKINKEIFTERSHNKNYKVPINDLSNKYLYSNNKDDKYNSIENENKNNKIIKKINNKKAKLLFYK